MVRQDQVMRQSTPGLTLRFGIPALSHFEIYGSNERRYIDEEGISKSACNLPYLGCAFIWCELCLCLGGSSCSDDEDSMFRYQAHVKGQEL
jgi:hypothetical protein